MVTIFVKHQIREGRIRIFSLFLVWKFLQKNSGRILEQEKQEKKIKAKARVQRLLVIKSCGYSMPFSMQMAIVCHTVFI